MVKMGQAPAGPPPAPSAEPGSLTRELARVEAANVAFYEAFKDRDIEAMARCWSQSPHARCVHPGWELVTGWPDIRRSWADIFESIDDLEISLDDAQVEVAGTVAWVNLVVSLRITTNDGDTFEASVVTTNLFEHANGEWLLVLHHSSNFVEDDEGDGEDDEPRTMGFFAPRSGSSSMN